MSKSVQQREEMMQNEQQRQGEWEQGLESSPYVNYSTLEDYKRKGYGTQGHLEPVETGKGGGATGAPTLSGSTLNKSTQATVFDPADPQRGR